jgi:hypothetical protein
MHSISRKGQLFMKAGAGNEPVNTTSPGSHGKSLHLIIHKVSEKFTWRRSEDVSIG